MRSARLGNRLTAGVQYNAKFEPSTTLSSVGSPRPSSSTTSISSVAARRTAGVRPVRSKNRKRAGNEKYSWSSRYPWNDRSVTGSSASSSSKPTGLIVEAGRDSCQGGAPLDGRARCQVRVAEIGLQLRDQHRRRRRQVVRVDDLEQRLREARELGIELQLDARGEEAEALEQPLDVGVGDLEAVHAEPRGNLRKLLRELRAHLAEMLQLEVVVLQQPRIHQATRVGARSAISTF